MCKIGSASACPTLPPYFFPHHNPSLFNQHGLARLIHKLRPQVKITLGAASVKLYRIEPELLCCSNVAHVAVGQRAVVAQRRAVRQAVIEVPPCAQIVAVNESHQASKVGELGSVDDWVDGTVRVRAVVVLVLAR